MSRFKMTRIRGVVPTMMTFFDKEENVGIQYARRMVDFMPDHGAGGFYLTGSTGEYFTITAEERNLVMDTVIDRVKGRTPVIVHVGDIGAKKSIELAKHACETGADVTSSVPPLYWKFRADDIYSYYKDISKATPPPMMVYGIQLIGFIDISLLLELVDLPSVHGLKYTARSHDEMGYLKERLSSGFMIYSDCDEMAFSGICAGADGIIGSFYSLFPNLYKKILTRVEASDIKGGMRLQKIADEVIFAALKYDFPSMLHGIMSQGGLGSGYPRGPFYNYEDSELTGLKEGILKVEKRYQAEELDMFHFQKREECDEPGDITKRFVAAIREGIPI